MKTLVIGATNIDIVGVSHAPLVEKDSNLGDVSQTIGGVAKNIVENLKYLGEEVSFITYIGTDVFTDILRKHLDSLEIDYSKAFFGGGRNNVYMAVHNNDGDMIYGINDMASLVNLSPEYFESIADFLDGFDTIVLDCNLSYETLKYLLKNYANKRIFVEGVSQSKVVKIRNLLNYVDLIKINNLELNALVNTDICDIIKDVRQLLKTGVKNIVVSSSNEPITYNVKECVYQSVVEEPERIENTVGAGDALFAGIIKALNHDLNMHDAVNYAKKIAAKTLECKSACNKDISQFKDL